MMTPLRFEETYQDEWAELEALLDRALGRKSGQRKAAAVSGARLAALYRRACEQLALARARAYPAYLVDRLERLTADGHQLIYHRRELGFARLKQVIAVEFPAAVRKRIAYVAVATAVFVLPTLIVGLLVYRQPEMILTVVDAETAASYEEMYSLSAESIGRGRTADTDWMMFGHYIRNNISVAFQCFAGGLFAGLGSLFFLGYNGVHSGAIGGYLTERGLSSTFYSFIVTHSAFELTAIVLSGAAGLQIGHALLKPARLTRQQALVEATGESAVVLYGVTAMLLVAAAIEAFWSSAAWLPHPAKYGVAVVCWIAVMSYFAFAGRHAD
jgi:uncharacterized membrane protein SpoIIM required for sporulation